MSKKMNEVNVYLIINHISVIAIKVIYKFQPVCFVTPNFTIIGKNPNSRRFNRKQEHIDINLVIKKNKGSNDGNY